MTGFEIPARKQRWLRAIGYGFLAEFTTVLTIIIILQTYVHVFAHGLTDAELAELGQRIGRIVGTIGGTIYTYIYARLVMLGLSSRFVEHGVVVALTALVFSVGGSIVGHHGLPAGYILASALKLAAGGLAGLQYSRSVSLNRSAA